MAAAREQAEMDNPGVLSIGPSEIGIPVRFSRRHYRRRANSAAWGWGNQGHEIVAIIAADTSRPLRASRLPGFSGPPRMQSLLKR